MGTASRSKPSRLPEKLRQIRERLNLSQDGIVLRMKMQDSIINRRNISAYELGKREPALEILLAYARLANVYVDVLIDNELDLPEEIPSRKKSCGVKRKLN